MKKEAIIQELVQIANRLDDEKLGVEAKMADDIIEKIAQEELQNNMEQKINDLISKWYREGQMAATQDSWLEWLPDEIEPEYRKDPGDMLSRNREQWESTDHFQIKYAKRMKADLEDAMGEAIYQDDSWIGYIQELKNSFWEGWEEASDIKL